MRFPDSLVLILAMVLIAQLATLVLPAGEYEREGRSVVPGTYARIEPPAEEETGGGLSNRLLLLVCVAIGLTVASGLLWLNR